MLKEYDRVTINGSNKIFKILGITDNEYAIALIEGGGVSVVKKGEVTPWTPCCTIGDQCEHGKRLLAEAFAKNQKYIETIKQKRPQRERFLAWKEFKEAEAKVWYHLGEV